MGRTKETGGEETHLVHMREIDFGGFRKMEAFI